MIRIIPAAFILIALFQISVGAQSLRIGIEGGALSVMGPDEFKNAAPDGLGMTSGLSLGIKAKFETPLSTFRFTGSVSYSSFSGEEDYAQIDRPHFSRLSSSAAYSKIIGHSGIAADLPNDMHSEATSRIISIGAGAEWKIIDWKASPYITGGLFVNYYDTKDKESNLLNADVVTEFKDSGTRLGGFLGAGAEIKLIEKLSLDVFARYNIYDLLSSSDMEGFIGEANNGVTALYLGAALLWRIF